MADIIPDFSSVDYSSIESQMSALIDQINNDTWFPNGSPSSFKFEDGTKVAAEVDALLKRRNLLQLLVW